MVESKYLTYLKSKSFYAITSISLILIIAIFAIREKDVEQSKEVYVTQNDITTTHIATTVEQKIKTSYEAIRTVSLLPGVRKIESPQQILPVDTIASIQQLYNNAFLNIQLSEIYIVPNNFNSQNISPSSKPLDKPIASFDEFITKKVIENENELELDDRKKHETLAIPEIENYEYEQMSEHLKTFYSKYPTNHDFERLDVPMLSGPEIITCDNSSFSEEDLKNNDNRNRNGFTFTVPKYNLKGQLNGAVSAILRTKVLESYLPPANFAIIGRDYKNQIINSPSQTWLSSLPFFAAGKNNPNLIYSKIYTLETPDLHPWELWVALPDALFYNSEVYKKIQTLFWVEFLSSILFILCLYKITYNTFVRNLELRRVSKILLTLASELESASNQLTLSSNAIQTSGSQQTRLASYISNVVKDLDSMTFKSLESLEPLLRTSANNLMSTTQAYTLFSTQDLTNSKARDELSEKLKILSDNAEKVQAKIMSIQGSLKEQCFDLNDITESSTLFNEYVKENERLSMLALLVAKELNTNSVSVHKAIVELNKIIS
jgi:hypothetical protein